MRRRIVHALLPCLLIVLPFTAACATAADGRATPDRLTPPFRFAGPAVLSVKDFGAEGNWNYADRTGADDTAAIRRAIDRAAVADTASNVVHLPPGSYRISSTLYLPNWVRLTGDNGRKSQIHADPDFTGSFMFHARNGQTSMFHNRLGEIWLRAHDNPGIRAVVKADTWQENDGLSRVVITGFTTYAVEIEFGHGGADTLRLEDCEFFAGPSARDDSAGIYVHRIGLVAGCHGQL